MPCAYLAHGIIAIIIIIMVLLFLILWYNATGWTSWRTRDNISLRPVTWHGDTSVEMLWGTTAAAAAAEAAMLRRQRSLPTMTH